ncbi:type VI secretion system protein ImpJ [Salinibacter ruber]|jgi:type VI secretion system protein ImpJ|uniref:type VI secretion system baseplate subunit TssK n=1 Tax=Salinibacter ruber TaxID=146919 RepID=UPI00161FB3D5|nr:type VI secretion system baseplate subunit TssK [Salinibacter ruber]MBB4070216.1 type VI secretion system protein ImpJ [Salinibacter ruber]
MARDGKKVVWFEGMTLDPHHFQQWDRYQRDTLNARLQAVEPYHWGLMRLNVDEERLENGELALLECTCVLPDGLVIDMPDSDPLPDVRNVQEIFPEDETRVRAVLAVPDERQDGRNVQLRNATQQRETRFVADSVDVRDENSGDNERPVEVAQTNVQLRFTNEAQQGYSTLPLVEIERTTGGFSLGSHFLPPCLHLDASDRLTELARQTLELLVSKSDELVERRQDAFSQRELSPSDVMALNLLGTVNSYIPQFKQYRSHGQHHPRELFRALASLAGELSTYVEDAQVHPRDLPTYQHEAPGEGFQQLETTLRRMIGAATPSSDYERIALEQDQENLYVASLSRDLLADAGLFLVARSDQHSDEKLTNALPNMLRVASPDTIDSVLQSYTQALSVETTGRLPTGIPADDQATYFQLDKRGPFWESVLEEEGIAIFLPSDFSDVEIELMAAL